MVRHNPVRRKTEEYRERKPYWEKRFKKYFGWAYGPVGLKAVSKSLRDRYKDAEMHTEYGPYSETEFCDYVRTKDDTLVESVMCAGDFLRQIEDLPHKDTLKGAIADYIVDELVINQVAHKHPDEVSRRAYSNYRMLYQRIQNGTQNNK